MSRLRDRVVTKLKNITYSFVSKVKDSLNFAQVVLAQRIHLHPDYMEKGDYPLTKRLNELKAERFSPQDHEHPEYLPKDTPALDAAALTGVIGGLIEDLDHKHPTYQTYIRTAPKEVRSANRIITDEELIVLPSVDKARRLHDHPQYIRKDGYVPLTRNFASYSKKGNRLLYSPQAFARRLHDHDWDYYPKDEALVKFATRAESFFRAEAVAPRASSAKLKLLMFEIDNTAPYSVLIDYPVKYLPLKTMGDLEFAILKAVTKEEDDSLDLREYYSVSDLIFIYGTEPNDVAEAAYHNAILSPRTLPVVHDGTSLHIKSLISVAGSAGMLRYFNWVERPDETFQTAAEFAVASDYPLGVIAVDEAFSLRSYRAAQYAPDVLIDPPNPTRLIVNREPKFPVDTTEADYAYNHTGGDIIPASDERVFFLHEEKKTGGPAIYVDVGTSDEIADAMENFFGDSAVLIMNPATVNMKLRLNMVAKDAPANSGAIPETVTVPESQTIIDPAGNFSIISLNTALQSMSDHDYVYVHLGRVSFKNKLFANLAILWLRLFGLYDQVIAGVQNSITFFINNLLAGLYPLLIKLPDIWLGPGDPPDDDYKYINLAPIIDALDFIITPFLDGLNTIQEFWDDLAQRLNDFRINLPLGLRPIDPIPDIPYFPWDVPSGEEWAARNPKILLPWIALWILDGFQLGYRIPLMESTAYGNRIESYVLFKRMKVGHLKELYTRFNSLSLFGTSPLVVGENVINPSLLFLPLNLKTPTPVTVQSNVYATIANHAIQLEGYRIHHAQVVPGRGTVSYSSGVDQDIPPVNKSHHVLGAAGSKAIRTYVPTSYGHLGPKLIGFLGNEALIRSGGQPYVLYLWVTESTA